jgi:hypothetical protein
MPGRPYGVPVAVPVRLPEADMRAGHVLLAAASVVAVVALAACAGPARAAAVAAVQDGTVDCASPAAREGFTPPPVPDPTAAPEPKPTPSGPSAGRIPDGFVAVAVVECDLAPGGTLERHLSGDLTTLVAALRQPDVPAPAGLACPAMFEIQPGLFLLDADGRYVHVAWPLDECQFIQKPARDALAALNVDDEVLVPVD